MAGSSPGTGPSEPLPGLAPCLGWVYGPLRLVLWGLPQGLADMTGTGHTVFGSSLLVGLAGPGVLS